MQHVGLTGGGESQPSPNLPRFWRLLPLLGFFHDPTGLSLSEGQENAADSSQAGGFRQPCFSEHINKFRGPLLGASSQAGREHCRVMMTLNSPVSSSNWFARTFMLPRAVEGGMERTRHVEANLCFKLVDLDPPAPHAM